MPKLSSDSPAVRPDASAGLTTAHIDHAFLVLSLHAISEIAIASTSLGGSEVGGRRVLPDVKYMYSDT